MNRLSIAILLLGFSLVFAATEIGVAHVVGTNVEPGISGTVRFTRINATHVLVRVDVTGITSNPDIEHGIHVHTYGDLQNATSSGLSVGGHFYGSGSTADHNCPENSDVRHEGDMGNWQVTGGVIAQEKEIDLLTLTGDSIIGRAVVVHEMTDDCATVPSSMKRLGWGVIGVANATGNAASNDNAANNRASCILSAAAMDGVTGKIWLEDDGTATRVYGYVDGLTAGSSHGFHIHAYGDITRDDGTAAGGHYNPDGAVHALPPATTRHVGDLPNLNTFDGDRAWIDYTSDLISLSGSKSVIGRAIIIHEKADDGCTQPTGNSGSRYAQCVIGIGSQDPVHWVPEEPTVTVPAPTAVTCTPAAAPVAAPVAATPKTSVAIAQRPVIVLIALALLAVFAL